MNTAWLQKAFVDLAGKSSEEAQQILRTWVTSRLLTMGDYNELADRLTAAYLERDAKRAANVKAMPRSKTGRLPPLADKAPRSRTGKLPPLPDAATAGGAPGPGPTRNPDPGSTRQPDPGPTRQPGPGPTRNPDPGSTRNPESGSTRQPDSGSTRQPGGGPTRPLQAGGTTPFSDRFRSRPPGGR